MKANTASEREIWMLRYWKEERMKDDAITMCKYITYLGLVKEMRRRDRHKRGSLPDELTSSATQLSHHGVKIALGFMSEYVVPISVASSLEDETRYDFPISQNRVVLSGTCRHLTRLWGRCAFNDTHTPPYWQVETFCHRMR